MTKSDLFGAVPATPGNVTLTISTDYSAAPQEEGDDFLAMMSQALTRNPENPVPSRPSDASSYFPQANYDTAYGSDGEADETQSATSNASKPGNQPATPATASNEDGTDPSVLSTIMAMFAQPTAPSADVQKLVPVQGQDLRITGGQGDSGAGEPDGRGGQESAQKLPASPNQLPPASPLNQFTGAASKSAKLAAIESLAHAGKTLPANVSPPGVEPPPSKTMVSPSTMPQLPGLQDVSLAAQESLGSAVPTDGMDAALNKQRMKFAAEKNEIAGRAVQKLPDASSVDGLASDLNVKASAKSDSDLSRHTKDSFDPNLLIDLSAKSSMTDLMQAKLADKTPSADTAAAQVERVAHLVTQEVITVRQSGANSLAVSLKVDSHTELFLQLNNHDGQMQASIRCERGNIDTLGSHWGQLQESLARQNVELLPLEDKGSFRNSTFNPPSDNASSRAFDQSSQNQQRPAREPHEELSLAGVSGVSRSSRKTTTNKSSRQGWESWA